MAHEGGSLPALSASRMGRRGTGVRKRSPHTEAQRISRQDSQDQQDRQELSSAFPDEKQKGYIKNPYPKVTFAAVMLDSPLVYVSFLQDSLSQFRPETEKRS